MNGRTWLCVPELQSWRRRLLLGVFVKKGGCTRTNIVKRTGFALRSLCKACRSAKEVDDHAEAIVVFLQLLRYVQFNAAGFFFDSATPNNPSEAATTMIAACRRCRPARRKRFTPHPGSSISSSIDGTRRH